MSLTFRLEEPLPEPSFTVEGLNNELVKMRKVVLKAKVFIVRDLIRYVKRLENKTMKKSDTRMDSKRIHRLEELQLLKRLSTIRLCKLILANEMDKSHLASRGHTLSVQDRLIVRLSMASPISKYVQNFRNSHSDWRSLVHYLLYKNISGKWKSRVQKRRCHKIRGSLPLPPAPTEIGETSEKGINECYRVIPGGNLAKLSMPATFATEEDTDSSDALSDVAEDVVNRLFSSRITLAQPAKKQPGVEENEVNNPETSTSHSKLHNKKHLPKVKKLKTTTDFLQQQCPNQDVPPSTAPPDAEQVASDIDPLFDENPLGSDDIDIKQQVRTKSDQSRGGNWKHRRGGPQLMRRGHSFPAKMTTSRSGSALQKKAMSNELENLHPSWQAKRKEKLKLSCVSALMSSAPKRIVFDN